MKIEIIKINKAEKTGMIKKPAPFKEVLITALIIYQIEIGAMIKFKVFSSLEKCL
jgi:hypothetical protein